MLVQLQLEMFLEAPKIERKSINVTGVKLLWVLFGVLSSRMGRCPVFKRLHFLKERFFLSRCGKHPATTKSIPVLGIPLKWVPQAVHRKRVMPRPYQRMSGCRGWLLVP